MFDRNRLPRYHIELLGQDVMGPNMIQWDIGYLILIGDTLDVIEINIADTCLI